MPDLWCDVDAAVIVPVNIMPLLDNTDFKTIEVAVVYNSAGMDLVWNFMPCAGPAAGTAVTPTTAGDYDWTEHVSNKGMYSIEIPASGGASINNNTEGVGWFTGVCDGVLPWRGPTIGFRRAALNDLLIEGGTASTNLEDFFDGTGYVGGTATLKADVIKILGTATATPATAGILDVNVKNIDNDAASASGTVTFPNATLASTTNITGGVTTTVTNLTNAPTSGDLTATMKTSVNTEVVDALNVDTYAEPGQGAPAATTTLAAKLNYLYKVWRNKKTQTATTYSLFNDDAATVDQKATVSDDGTTATKGEVATGP